MLIAIKGSTLEDFSCKEALEHLSKQRKRRILNTPPTYI